MAEVSKPSVMWAQRKDAVYLTVDIKDAQDLKVQLDETTLEFACRGGDDGKAYEFILDLHKPINRETSKWSTKRFPQFYLRKAEIETWPKLQKAGKLPWVKVDWSKWADSDDEDEKGAFDVGDMEGLDFSGVSQEEVDGDDDHDSILADLDEPVAVETDDEAA